MVARPTGRDLVVVEYVDGAQKTVRRDRLGELSSRWRVVDDPAQAEGTQDQPPEPPAKSANKATWFRYALDRGASREAIHDLTRKQLIDRFGDQLGEDGGEDGGQDGGEDGGEDVTASADDTEVEDQPVPTEETSGDAPKEE
jgi:hypothetical protein